MRKTIHQSDDTVGVVYSSTLRALIEVTEGSEGLMYVQPATDHIVAAACVNRPGVTEVVFGGNNVTFIDEEAFAACDGLTHMELPDSILEIADSAFAQCYNLESIKLPRRLQKLAPHVLEDCNLKSVEIPKSVTVIGEGALAGNDELTTIHIPRKVREIGTYAFCCKGLQSITVVPNSGYFTSIDGVLYDKKVTRLVAFPPNWPGKEFRIPDTVKAISDGAFRNAKLESVYIPRGIRVIPIGTFSRCRNLRTVRGMAGVEVVEPEAFAGCPLEDMILQKFTR